MRPALQSGAQFDMFPDIKPGMIAVMQSGARIAIWPCESDDPSCFTGQLLEEGASLARARVINTSILWLRDKVVRVERAKRSDQRQSLVGLRFEDEV